MAVQNNEAKREQDSWEGFLKKLALPEEVYESIVNPPAQKEPFPGYTDLVQQLRTAFSEREEGAWKNLPEDIFIETLKCFTRFIKEHKVSYGFYGFDRGFWTIHQIHADLFRIGELEYQMVPEDHFLALHIPSDADLSTDAVKKSIQEARDFFHLYFPEYDGAEIRCHSWLLSPALPQLLPESSHILSFQKLFRITKMEWELEDYLEWVFKVAGGQRKTLQFESVPENTTLQRNMKCYVRNGGKIGVATGILL